MDEPDNPAIPEQAESLDSASELTEQLAGELAREHPEDPPGDPRVAELLRGSGVEGDREAVASIVRLVSGLEQPRAPSSLLEGLDHKIRRRRPSIADRLASSMISLPLQLLCILLILVGATLKLMSTLEQETPQVEAASASPTPAPAPTPTPTP